MMKQFKNRFAFTATEMIIAVVIMATVITLMATAIRNITPNEDKLLFRQSYYKIEQVINSLTNDAILYPKGDLSDMHAAQVDGIKYEGIAKFLKAFKSKFNVLEEFDITSNGATYNCFTANTGVTYCMQGLVATCPSGMIAISDFCISSSDVSYGCLSSCKSGAILACKNSGYTLPSVAQLQSASAVGADVLTRSNYYFAENNTSTDVVQASDGKEISATGSLLSLRCFAEPSFSADILILTEFDKLAFDALSADCKKQHIDSKAFFVQVKKDGAIELIRNLECYDSGGGEIAATTCDTKLKHSDYNQCKSKRFLKDNKIGGE